MDRQTDEWMDRWTDKHKMHKVEWTYILTYIHTYKWVYQLVRLSVVLTFYRMLLISHCVLYEGMFVFQLRPRHSTTNSTIAMWRVCVSLWYAHTKLYTLLDVVMFVFLLLLRRLSCALGRCVRPSIHSSVCLSFSQSTTKPTSIIKVYYFFFFFLLLPFHLYTLTHSLAVFFACLCFFRGLYMDFITFKSRKNQQAIPNNNNKNKNKKSSALSSPFSQWRRRPPNNELCSVVCSLVCLFVRSFVVHMYMRLVVNMFDCLCCSCCCCCVMLLVTVVSKALT